VAVVDERRISESENLAVPLPFDGKRYSGFSLVTRASSTTLPAYADELSLSIVEGGWRFGLDQPRRGTEAETEKLTVSG